MMHEHNREKALADRITTISDAIGVSGLTLAIFLGIPTLALQLAWYEGRTLQTLAMAALLLATACSGWRDMERGHIGKLSASLCAASLAALGWLILPLL